MLFHFYLAEQRGERGGTEGTYLQSRSFSQRCPFIQTSIEKLFLPYLVKWPTFKLNGVDWRCTQIHGARCCRTEVSWKENDYGHVMRHTSHTTEHRNHKRDLPDDASLTKMSNQVDIITKIASKASGHLKVVHYSNMERLYSMAKTRLHILTTRAYDPWWVSGLFSGDLVGSILYVDCLSDCTEVSESSANRKPWSTMERQLSAVALERLACNCFFASNPNSTRGTLWQE